MSLRFSNSLNLNLHKIRMLLKLFVKFILFGLFKTTKVSNKPNSANLAETSKKKHHFEEKRVCSYQVYTI